jgi:hypothetical protein
MLIPRCTHLSNIFVGKHIVQPFSCQITALISLNFFQINLLPNINEAKRFNNMGLSIFLMLARIFHENGTTRLNSMANHVVHPAQTALMQGKNTLDRY